MIRNISVGIDIGSSKTRVVVGEFLKGEKIPRVIGVGESESQGMRHGYVVNSELVSNSLRTALLQAERTSGIKIKRAFVSLSGATLKGETSSGTTIVSKADGEVTTLDVNKALSDCEENLNAGNKKIVHMFPVSFRLDGKDIQGRIEGLRGTKLEAKAIFITYSTTHLEDLLSAIAEVGVEATDVVASPVAINNLVLSEKQKIVGVALVDIGSETTSLSVFENGLLVSMNSFSIGSSDITNDIALGFKIPLEKAEELKLGKNDEGEFSKKKLEEIIEARLCDIFELIENNLKKQKRAELLPAGIVFVGGGANTKELPETSKSVLKLPSSVGTTEIFGNAKTKFRDPSWFNVIGLLIESKNTESYSSNSVSGIWKEVKNALKASLKQLMP
jgi:cell division protein FtsA